MIHTGPIEEQFTYMVEGFRLAFYTSDDPYVRLLEKKFATWYATREEAQHVKDYLDSIHATGHVIEEDVFCLPHNMTPEDLVPLLERVTFEGE